MLRSCALDGDCSRLITIPSAQSLAPRPISFLLSLLTLPFHGTVIYLSGDYHEKARKSDGVGMDHKTGTEVNREEVKDSDSRSRLAREKWRENVVPHLAI